MADDHKAKVITPADIDSGEGGSFPFDFYSKRYLAQGDSWFSIGSFPPGLTSNVVDELELSRSTAIVNCARPGKVLRHMSNTTRELVFTRLLAGRLAIKWDAILISGGGNDLIDAAGVAPHRKPHERLLATIEERPNPSRQADDYLSEPGWAVFATHIAFVFHALIDLRDSTQINRRVPLYLHTYAHLAPRPVGAGAGFGPWLAPSLKAFAVPPDEWQAVSDALLDRLAALMLALVDERRKRDSACAVHLIDTREARLELADPKAPGASGDFLNEIHPTRRGYRKLAAVWRKSLDALP